MNYDNGKVLDSHRVERTLLGGLIQEPALLLRVRQDLSAREFHHPVHAALFDLLGTMSDQGQVIDIVTVMERVQFLGADRFGGAGYVAELPDTCTSTANVPGYVPVILEHARVRRLRHLSIELANAAHGTGPFADMPAAEIAAEWMPRLGAIGTVRGAKVYTSTLLDALLEAVNERLDREAGCLAPLLTTGFGKLDDLIKVRAGDLIIIGGEPSMGKSALAQAFAMEFGQQGVGRVGYFSLEMPRRRLAMRLASYALGIPIIPLTEWTIDADDQAMFERFLATLEVGMKWNLELVDRPACTVDYIEAEATSMWARGGLRAIVVDHLHLMKHPKRESRAVSIGETSARLKQLALDLGVPVFCLSQLNRQAQRRADPRASRTKGPWWDEVAHPQLSDLRESGDIEANADVVLFPIHADKCGVNLPRAGAVIVAKQRDGALGTVGVEWDGPCAAYRPYGQAHGQTTMEGM